MQLLYTPTSLVYISQLFLTVVFGVHFSVVARQGRPSHVARLAAFLLLLALGIVTLTLESLLVDAARLVANALKYPIFAAVLLALVQFAYHFPEVSAERKTEARRVGLVLSIFFAAESINAVYRLWQLANGYVDYQVNVHDVAIVMFYGLVPIIFLRRIIDSERQGRSLLLMLVRPQGAQRALRAFVFAFGTVAFFALISLLRGFSLVSGSLANAATALGLLLMIFLTAVGYVNALPEMTTLMFRLVGVTLATVLGTLGVLGWYVALLISPQIDSNLLTQRALSFVPNTAGGYSVDAVPYRYRDPGGEVLTLREGAPHDCAPVAFPITFYDVMYEQIFVCNDGTISFGSAVRFNTYQRNYGNTTPVFLALLTDLDPARSSGTVTVERVDRQLVVSWHDLASFYDARRSYRFQTWLEPNGKITVQYARVPQLGQFTPDERPTIGGWAVGAVPGRYNVPVTQVSLTELPIDGGPDGLVHDFWLEYRAALAEQLRPVGAGIVAVSTFILLVFPRLFNQNLLRPLDALVRAVSRMQAGDYRTQVPVTAPDEIGFLTAAFNRMAAELAAQVETLERRVASRTAELDRANEQLQREMAERFAAEEQLVREQRRLAALEERERLGRDLHDSLGQTFGSIAMHAQTAANLIELGNRSHALLTMTRIDAAARRGHAEVRDMISDLRVSAVRGFLPALLNVCEQLRRESPLIVEVRIADDWDAQWLSPLAASNLLRICQEALANVQRHAAARHVTVELLRDSDQLQLAVTDDGSGMAALQAELTELGHGMSTMRERAEELGGCIQLTVPADGGTRVSVTIPYVRYADEADAPATQAAPAS